MISTTKAQFEKGQKMLGGQFSFYNQKTDASNSMPKNISSGISASFSYSQFESPRTFNSYGFNFSYGDNGSNSINKSAGVFYNYTKLEPLVKKLFFTYMGTAAINYFEFNNSYPGSDKSNTSRITPSVSIGLGLLYQLNNCFVISTTLLQLASLSYNFDKNETIPVTNSPFTTKSNSVYFNSGLNGFSLNNISIGLNYLLKKK